MNKRRVVEVTSLKKERESEPPQFKEVPLELSEMVRSLKNYGKNRYAKGMLRNVSVLDRWAEDLIPFSSVTPELDEFIISLRREASMIRSEAHRILEDIEKES